MQCGIIEARHSEDAVGYACTTDAVAPCFDCGIPVCGEHAEHCDLCDQMFCARAYGFTTANSIRRNLQQRIRGSAGNRLNEDKKPNDGTGNALLDSRACPNAAN
jgi:hypothetical protein